MKKTVISIFLSVLFAAAAYCGEGEVYRCDFDSRAMLRNECRFHYRPFTPHTHFRIADEPTAGDRRVLVVETKHSSGFMIFRIKGLDLQKFPRMRWRWRIIRRTNIPDGVDPEPDDQACVVYITSGDMLNQQCVGYRWEHNTPVGLRRMVEYPSGLVSALCVRNRETPLGEWMVEEHNVLEDFKAAFGQEPAADFVITIGGNSQHSKSPTRVEIDYIEFLPATEKDK